MPSIVLVLRESRIGHVHFVPGSGQANVEQPPRFAFLLIIFGGPGWQLSLIHAHHDNDIKFLSFCAM